MTRSLRTLRLGLDDLGAGDYRTVPLEVAANDESVEVDLAYDRRDAVIDLGFEGPGGWRGWSGSARNGFVIRPDAATPGYVAGPLEPGTWSVQLGLHRLPAEPVDVAVRVTVPAQSSVGPEVLADPRPGSPRASERRLPAPRGLTWFAGDFHTHTTHSDGTLSVDQVAALAVAGGLDFVAITDHNTVSHHSHLAAAGARHDIALLPGQELTTRRGHANAFGGIGFVDFREAPTRWLSEVAARGGVLSINHPLDGAMAWQHPLPTLPAALELWHATWFRDLESTAPWALWSRWRRDAVLLGGSDFHTPDQSLPPGTPATWVAAEERSPEALFAAVAAGRTAIARASAPAAPTLLRVEDDLVAVDADGTVLGDVEGRRRVVHGDRVTIAAARAGAGPFRLEDQNGGVLAISP